MLHKNLSCLAFLIVLLSVLVCQSWAYYYERRENSCDVKPEDVTREEIENMCKIYGIVPDVLSSPPPYFAKVQYGQHLCPRISAILPAHHLKFFPTKLEWPGRKEDFYTVMLIDPDAPSRHAAYEREYLHWLVVNVQGPEMTTRETLVDYVPPEPLIGTVAVTGGEAVFQQDISLGLMAWSFSPLTFFEPSGFQSHLDRKHLSHLAN